MSKSQTSLSSRHILVQCGGAGGPGGKEQGGNEETLLGR